MDKDYFVRRYKNLIIDSLHNKGVIDDELYVKCTPEYIASLPYDLRYSDTTKLLERRTAIEDRMAEVDDIIDSIDDAIGYYQRTADTVGRALESYENDLHGLEYKIGVFEDWDEERLNEKREVADDLIKTFEGSDFNYSNSIQNNYDDKIKPLLDRIKNEYDTSILSIQDLNTLDDAVDLWDMEFGHRSNYDRLNDMFSEYYNEDLSSIYSAIQYLTTYEGYTHQSNTGSIYYRNHRDYIHNLDLLEQTQERIKDANRQMEYWESERDYDISQRERYVKMLDDYTNELERLDDKIGYQSF